MYQCDGCADSAPAQLRQATKTLPLLLCCSAAARYLEALFGEAPQEGQHATPIDIMALGRCALFAQLSGWHCCCDGGGGLSTASHVPASRLVCACCIGRCAADAALPLLLSQQQASAAKWATAAGASSVAWRSTAAARAACCWGQALPA